MGKIKPLGNRVLVKRSEAQKTKGGILLPDSATEKPRQGEVLMAGPGKYNENGELEPMEVKAGDQVLFGPYAGTEVKDSATDEELLILSQNDILGVLTN